MRVSRSPSCRRNPVTDMERWGKTDYLSVSQIVGLIVVALIGLWTAQISNTTHALVNSRMTELLELTRTASEAKGEKRQQDLSK